VPAQTAEGIPILDALVHANLIKSRSEGRRLVEQGAVTDNGTRVIDALGALIPGSHLVRIGKRRFIRFDVRPK
jgi:tyrosyl-tRNA synthetase